MNKQSYSGVDNLETLREAKNYNHFLAKEILRYSGGKTLMLDLGAGWGTFAELLTQRGG